MSDTPALYAALDLGSNSFHMLIVRKLPDGPQTLLRVKRKVRLASGLSPRNILSREAMERGWQCLRLFAERLQDIPPQHIRIVATATLRLAINARDFLQQARQILGCPVQIISGEEEARLIYQGVAHTTGGAAERLVIDIGGASTELVAGTGAEPKLLFSLPMGCVTWLDNFFAGRVLSRASFNTAQQAAEQVLQPISHALRQHGWQICVGASGTVQALQAIMMALGMDEHITLARLLQLEQRAIACGRLESLDIAGLTLERALVFPSGLAILIAIFRQLDISSMTLAGGALREGLVYDMLKLAPESDIRLRTLRSLQYRFPVDTDQARRVSALAARFARSVESQWQLDEFSLQILGVACQLHEIGLNIDCDHAAQHGAWLINRLDLPGFTPAQKNLLAALLLNQTHPLDLPPLHQQHCLSGVNATRLCRLLRLALIFSCRRRDDVLPDIALSADQEKLRLSLPAGWLVSHPLSAEALQQEKIWQSAAGWQLELVLNNPR